MAITSDLSKETLSSELTPRERVPEVLVLQEGRRRK